MGADCGLVNNATRLYAKIIIKHHRHSRNQGEHRGGGFFVLTFMTFTMGSKKSNKEVTVEDNSKKVPLEDTEETDDLVTQMLKKTGCLEKHYGVQECIAETKDWRQCQKQVGDFRACMEDYKKREKLPNPNVF